MVPIILALVIGATITVPITGWILSLNQNIGETNAKLEASTVSTEEWNRLGHMSLEELRAQKETLKEPYPVGDYKVMVNLGEEGYFSDGKCGTVPSGRVANCFDNTTITVFNADGDRQFNSRQLPLQVGIYTKEEIDGLLNGIKSDYEKRITDMQTVIMSKMGGAHGPVVGFTSEYDYGRQTDHVYWYQYAVHSDGYKEIIRTENYATR